MRACRRIRSDEGQSPDLTAEFAASLHPVYNRDRTSPRKSGDCYFQSDSQESTQWTFAFTPGGKRIPRGGAKAFLAENISDPKIRAQEADRRRSSVARTGHGRLVAHPPPEGLGRRPLAGGVSAAPAGTPMPSSTSILEETAGNGRRRQPLAVRRQHGRPGDLHLRQDEQKEYYLPAHRQSRRLVVSGLLRARLRLRSRLAQDQGGAQRRPSTSSTARRPGPRSAQYADWIFCLCRTNPEAKKQEGISFLLIDMKTPGIDRAPHRHDRRRP
jgi:hypothetical protein